MYLQEFKVCVKFQPPFIWHRKFVVCMVLLVDNIILILNMVVLEYISGQYHVTQSKKCRTGSNATEKCLGKWCRRCFCLSATVSECRAFASGHIVPWVLAL